MISKRETNFIGKVRLIEPIIASGKSFGIKLLSVHDFLTCEAMHRNLVNKLIEKNMDKILCQKVCEQACVVAMCLYNTEGKRVFNDGLSVLINLTSEELQRIYNEYVALNEKIIKFDEITSKIINNVKNCKHVR